jgi:hypothetical protein
VPEIDVHLIDAQDQPPQGGGEPAIIFIGGCVLPVPFSTRRVPESTMCP